MARSRGLSPLIHFLIIVIGAIAGYLFYSSSTIDDASQEIQVNTFLPGQETTSVFSSSSELEFFSSMNFDLSILDDESYKSLGVIGERNTDSGLTGKTNPFAPL